MGFDGGNDGFSMGGHSSKCGGMDEQLSAFGCVDGGDDMRRIACLQPKKRVFGVLVLGALCGLGLWIDQRVLLFIPVSIALLMYRSVRQRSVWLMVAFALFFGGAWNVGSWSDGRERILRVETKMEQQRAVVQRFQRFRGLKDSCGHIPKSDLLTVPYLGSDCAKATLADNVEYRFSMSHVYGMWGWWMMGGMSLLAFVYRPWVYRILCFGVGIPTVIWMMWTPFPDRYMMLMAVPSVHWERFL